MSESPASDHRSVPEPVAKSTEEFFSIQSLTFSAGDKIELEPNSTLLLVGPNNCGKTKTLHEIDHILAGGHLTLRPNLRSTVVVQHLGISSEESKIRDGLASRFPVVTDVDGNNHVHFLNVDWQLSRGGGGISPYDSYVHDDLKPFVVHMLSTSNRLQLAHGSQRIRLYSEPPKHYLHILQADEKLYTEISQVVRKSFGVNIVLNWHAPNVILHIGDEPVRTRAKDRVSNTYIRELELLPTLNDQGDGIKSFIGMLLACRCAAHPLLLIDEPEAFLHPPQSRQIAEVFAQSAENQKRQVIVATHSSDIVQGALNVSDRVAICRITRQGNRNHACLLPSNKVRELLKDPLLRSTAAVNGLFHKGVVVCEGDADTQIYAALSDQLVKTGRLSNSPDLYFVHGGGKGKLATLATIYRSLAVPLAVIADLDLLRQKAQFTPVLEALGGDLNDIGTQYNSACHALTSQTTEKLHNILAIARQLLDSAEKENKLSNSVRNELKELFEPQDNWSEAKKHGIRAVNGVENAQAIQELLAYCQKFGLFLVSAGELEGWAHGAPAKSSGRWFTWALEEIDKQNPEFNEARDFMFEVCTYLAEPEPGETVSEAID